MLRTLRRRPDIAFELIWRPFLLNPDMPRLGMPRPDYVVRKFGGEDRAKRLYATISEVGRHEGLEFRFDRIRREWVPARLTRLGEPGLWLRR